MTDSFEKGRNVCGLIAGAALLLFCACITTTPLQTASTVPEGTFRLGAQLTTTPYCGVTLVPNVYCAYPSRGIPVPELRLSVRRGFSSRVDGAVSVFSNAVIPYGIRAGGLVDGKVQVWEQPAEEGRRLHLISVGAGAGVQTLQSGLFGVDQRSNVTEVLLVVPVFYGYQSEHWEWVVSPRYAAHLGFDGVNTSWVGLTGGVVRRTGLKWGLMLDYFAPTGLLAEGLWTLTGGVLFDVGGKPPEPANLAN